MEDSRKGLFQILLVHKLDRFSRDQLDFINHERMLLQNNVKLLSVTERFENSPNSNLYKAMTQVLAQYYSQNLALEVMKGMKESAYQARHLGGIPPLGYDIVPDTKKYVINEAEAEIVRKIFELYSDGVGYKQILGYLNGMGYLTKRGKPFGPNSLYTILKNDKYAGVFVFNKKREKTLWGVRNPQLKPREEWIVVDNGTPAIIDKEIFRKVQEKMEENARNGGRFKAKQQYLLSGLIFCGECGASMFGNSRPCGRKKVLYSSYRCSNRLNHQGCDNKEIRREYLENYVLDQLYNTLFTESSIRKLKSMLNEYKQEKVMESNKELQAAEKKLRETLGGLDRLLQLVADGGISMDTVGNKIKTLEKQKRQIETRIHEIKRDNQVHMATEEEIVELVRKSGTFVKEHNIPECRNFIESYIAKVTVYRERVEIRFKICVPEDLPKVV